MKTEQLVEICRFARSCFPHLERITVYGSARFVNRKSLEELIALKEAGLDRIHMGMESGMMWFLQEICKGTSSEEIIEAGLKPQTGRHRSERVLPGRGRGPQIQPAACY